MAKNQELAKILYEIADYFEMEGVAFKPYAYRKAALSVEALQEDVGEIYSKGGTKLLENIPGVGRNIANEIKEYLERGKIKRHQIFRKKLPLNLNELTAIEGMGPRKAKILYQKLGAKDLKSLERAARSHKIAPLFGFGQKTEQNILQGISFLKRSKGRFLLGEILPTIEEAYEKIAKLRGVEKINVAGSVRRMKETVGDVDFLVLSKNPKKVMDFCASLPEVVRIWGKGATKTSLRLEQGFDMDIRVVAKRSYGSALQYFTGSKEHNIAIRKIAIDRGLKLSEYGLFRGKKIIAGETEKGIYKKLGLQWMPPELRENQGEIEASSENKLPQLINIDDIRGDLHLHTTWSEGKQTIEEMASMAKAMGYEYLGISDHANLPVANGLDEKRFLKQMKEIDGLNKKIGGIKILKGAEINILKDGSLDIKDQVLDKMDYVIAGIHSSFKMGKAQMTERIIRAMRNPRLNIISHLTARKIGEREECQMDLGKIIRAAKEYNIVLEVNSQPKRMDLKDINIRRAKEAGVKMVISTDAHNGDHLRFMELGVAQARRGWAEKKDIINTQSLGKLSSFIKKKKNNRNRLE